MTINGDTPCAAMRNVRVWYTYVPHGCTRDHWCVGPKQWRPSGRCHAAPQWTLDTRR